MQAASAEFIVLDLVDSTNNYAMALIHTGMAAHGKCCFALEQFAGKGRRSRCWQAEAGTNILMSTIIKPQIPVQHQFRLSMAVASATHKLLTKHIEGLTIKWPNDIYWNDSKTGGILIENVLKGMTWQWAVIGTGINVNQESFSSELPNPVSLKQITGKETDVFALAKELRDSIIAECNLLENDFQEIYKYYNTNLYKSGEIVKLKQSNAVFETRISHVEENGRLIVDDTMRRDFGMDEVEWVK